MKCMLLRAVMMKRSVCSVAFLIAIGCSAIRHRDPIEQVTDTPGAQAKESHEYLASVHSWIDTILVGGTVSVPVSTYIDFKELSARARINGPSWAFAFDGNCRGFSPVELAFVIAAGPSALPSLIELVHSEEPTPWVFHYPTSSKLCLETRLVGEMACYMIEAILRKNIYFTRTARLDWQECYVADSSRTDALHDAANAYEEWYARCFDRQTQRITCAPDDLPDVAWEYDLEAGASLVEVVSR